LHWRTIKKRDDDYKFYALSEEEERDVVQAFQEGVLASSTGGKMLRLDLGSNQY
jgi:hypothetical protein